jgi:hypothetical protein
LSFEISESTTELTLAFSPERRIDLVAVVNKLAVEEIAKAIIRDATTNSIIENPWALLTCFPGCKANGFMNQKP